MDHATRIELSIVIITTTSDLFYVEGWIERLRYVEKKKTTEVVIVISGAGSRERAREFYDRDIVVVPSEKQLLPGEARNTGLNSCKGRFVVFLDSRTEPTKTWVNDLEVGLPVDHDVSWGFVRYEATNRLQRVIIGSTYGAGKVRCLPGSVIRRSIFEQTGKFLPKIRCAEDVDWMQRVRLSHISQVDGNREELKYRLISKEGIIHFARKWARNYECSFKLGHLYWWHRLAYAFMVALIAIGIAVTWNWIIAKWSTESQLYVPYISKKVGATLGLLYICLRCIWLPWRKGLKASPLRLDVWMGVLLVSATLDFVKVYALLKGNIEWLVSRQKRDG